MIGIELIEDPITKAPLPGEKIGQLMGYLLNHGALMIPCGRYSKRCAMPSLTISANCSSRHWTSSATPWRHSRREPAYLRGPQND